MLVLRVRSRALVAVWPKFMLDVIFKTLTFRPYISGPEVRTAIFSISSESLWPILLHIKKISLISCLILFVWLIEKWVFFSDLVFLVLYLKTGSGNGHFFYFILFTAGCSSGSESVSSAGGNWHSTDKTWPSCNPLVDGTSDRVRHSLLSKVFWIAFGLQLGGASSIARDPLVPTVSWPLCVIVALMRDLIGIAISRRLCQL